MPIKTHLIELYFIW